MNPSRITRFTLICFIAALVVGLSGCDELLSILSLGDLPEVGDTDMPGEIEIGLVVPLTGMGAAPYGFSMHRGFQLAQEEINSSQLGNTTISFIAEDDMSTADGAVSAYLSLVAQGVPAVVGYAFTTQVDEVFPLAEESQVVTFSSVSSGAGRSALSTYAFRAGAATDIQNPALVTGSHAKLGYTKVAMIYDEKDAYSQSSHADLSAALADLGVEVVGIHTFQTGDTDFSTQLTAIMGSDAEALMISALAGEMVLIMSQGREIGIPASVRYILPDLTANEVTDLGDAAEGAITVTSWFSESDTPGNQAFVQNYQAKFGMEADPWAAQSYATLYILADAIAKAGSTDSTAIRDALAQTMNFDTVLGQFSFDANGEANYDPIVLTVKDGQLTLFEDVEMPADDDMMGDGTTTDDTSGGTTTDDTSGGTTDDTSGGATADDTSGGTTDDTSGGTTDDTSGGMTTDDTSGGTADDDTSGGNGCR